MAHSNKKTTLEDLQNIIRELGELQKEFQKESQKEREEYRRRTEESQKKDEDVRRKYEESRRKYKEAREKDEEAWRKDEKKFRKELQESQKKTEESWRKLQMAERETKKALKSLSQSLKKSNGNFNNKWGRFMENLVKGDLVNLLSDRKMDVIRILSRVPYYRPDKTQEGEIDLIAVDGRELVAIEIKTYLTVKSVDKFIKILESFQKYFPEYAKKKIYGGMGYLDERDDAGNYAKSEGLFVIKAPGGKAKVSTITNAKDFEPREFGNQKET